METLRTERNIFNNFVSHDKALNREKNIAQKSSELNFSIASNDVLMTITWMVTVAFYLSRTPDWGRIALLLALNAVIVFRLWKHFVLS